MRRHGLLGAALCALLVSLSGCAATTIPSVHSEPERLSLAQRMMEQQRWVSAIELLKSYVQHNGGSANVDRAHYLLGMSYLKNKDWALAESEFELTVREYPESDSTPSASYRLGEALLSQARPPDFDQDFTTKAIEQWHTYLETYPDHWLNAEAGKQLVLARSRIATKLLNTAELYLRLKLPGPARVYFERVRSDYNDTLLLPQALLGLALCDARDGRRVEAIAQLKDIESRYSGSGVTERAARERSRLERKHGS